MLVVVVLLILAFLFRNVRIFESYADYTGCTPQGIEAGCHGDAVRTNLLGLVTPLSIFFAFLATIIFGLMTMMKRYKKK